MDIDLQEEEVSVNIENKDKAGDVTIDNVMELECNVTDVNMEEMAQDYDTNTLREDVLVETEDENNMNVKDKEVIELEDEMAQDDKSSKEKDVFEKTA